MTDAVHSGPSRPEPPGPFESRWHRWWNTLILREPWASKVWLSGGFALLAWSLWRHQRFFHDDAFITLRYARQLLVTGRPEWNPGERVEGFTSLLHLLAVTVSGAVITPMGADWMLAARLVNWVAMVVLLLAGWLMLCGAKRGSAASPAISWCGLAASAPLAIWTWGGLEAVLAGAWVACGMMVLVHTWMSFESGQGEVSMMRFALAGLCQAMAVATRPDTLTMALGIAAALWVVELRKGRGLLGFRLAMAWLLPVGVVHLLILGWRWHTYHELLPNTYYAKVFGLSIGHRLFMGAAYMLRSLPDVVMLPVALVVLFMQSRWCQDGLAWIAVGGLLPFLMGIVWVGGDHMAAARFLVPCLPLMGLLLACLMDEASSAQGRAWPRRALLVGLTVMVLWPVVRPVMRRDPAAWVGQLVGQQLDRQWPAGALVAINTAGAPAFHAPQLRFIDMLGLNDAHIARRVVPETLRPMQNVPGHAKGDGLYVLSREPDVVIAGFAEGQSVADSQFLGDMELAGAPEFKRCYRMVQVSLPYDDAYARLVRYPLQPLLFTYYQRTCAKLSAHPQAR